MPKSRQDGVPKSFQLAGHKIAVKTIPVKKWAWGENVLAMWLPAELRIELRGDLEGSHRQAVWLHEVVHAILDTCAYHQLSADEEFCDRFANGLHQLLTSMK